MPGCVDSARHGALNSLMRLNNSAPRGRLSVPLLPGLTPKGNGPAPALFRCPDIGLLDHLRPFADLGLDIGIERVSRAWGDRHAEIREALLGIGLCDQPHHLGI